MDGVSVVILCGGSSNRMGEDKKFLTYRGRTFLEHAVDTARAVSEKIVVGSMEQKEATTAVTELPVCVDEVEGVGPIMGILTGFENIDTEYGAVLPIDTPLARPEVMNYLVSLREGHDAVVPEDRGYLEPLHAVYRRDAIIHACRRSLDAGVRSVQCAPSVM
ncbi:MAG: molybdenum cofactor guanylyltransferase [Euryarchaeota archaeon]|nr:molybdenum cofactor guanylyltransferase [Euryarchaeota archaeon]